MRRVILIVAGLAAIASPLAAQTDTLPKRGTWGAEASFPQSATLLRFRNPGSAWLLGLTADYSQQEFSASGTTLNTDATQHGFNALLRGGIRFYREPTKPVRPFIGVAGLVGFNDTTNGSGWQFGGD